MCSILARMWPRMLRLRPIIHRRPFRIWPRMLIHMFRIFRILRRMLHHSNIAFRKRIYVEMHNTYHAQQNAQTCNWCMYVQKAKCANVYVLKLRKMRNKAKCTTCDARPSLSYLCVYICVYICCRINVYLYKKQILYILRTYATPKYIYMCICIYIHTLSGHLEWRPCVATLTGENIHHCPSGVLRGPRGMF
jgi:hypothetical protein